MELSNQAELKILEAAEKVFYSKGKDGASMQDIADEAGITRTSLNYYYRSKDKLFESVFRNTMSQFVPKIAELLHSTEKISAYIPELIEIIIDSMIEKPQIPVFVLSELTSNPGRVPQLMSELGIHPVQAVQKIKDDPLLSRLPVDPRQLMMNLLSMCIFPFAGKPLFVSVMFQGDEAAFIEAMRQRKQLIPRMIEAMINNFDS